MNTIKLYSWLIGMVFILCPVMLLQAQDNTKPDTMSLFRSGTDGYKSYRIPAIITTTKGTILAFCEGRKNSAADAGDIDLLLKRSVDGGKTWSAQQVIWDDSTNTCGNPCPVVDESTGAICLLMTHNLGEDKEGDIVKRTARSTRTVWISKSSDDGVTWTKPEEITSTTKKTNWGWYATGPGIGIQIKYGPHKGRLVIPCDFNSEDTSAVPAQRIVMGSHVIYSDDHGATWKLGGTIVPKVNECQVVEVADGNGTLLMNMRSYFQKNCRTHAISYDGGITWTAPYDVPALVEPICQASIIRYTWPGKKQKSCILFLNPASTGKRHNMTIRASYDEGQTWPVIRTLYAGPSAYSCMTILPKGIIGCLYEAGAKSSYETIVFQKVMAKDIF
jgi:sialidase-1